jgi:hypothetical protein
MRRLAEADRREAVVRYRKKLTREKVRLGLVWVPWPR